MKTRTVHSITVDEFVYGCEQHVDMELLAGKSGLNRKIREAAVNRPGLALTGFFNYFANKRVQVLGWAELAYLASLDSSECHKRLREFFAQKIPCVFITRGKRAMPGLIELADEFGIPLLRVKSITKHFVNIATIVMENMMAPHTKIQSTMMEIMGVGVLIEGPPGIGKSDVALGLIKMGHALVSDDVTAIRMDSSGSLIGYPVRATRYHMEIRGMGIIHVPSLFGVSSVRYEKRLDLVVSLCRPEQRAAEDRTNPKSITRTILGVNIPRIVLAVTPGRNIPVIVEAAALNMKLKRLGHDAEKELDEQLVALISSSRASSE